MLFDLSPSTEKKNVETEDLKNVCIFCYLHCILLQMKLSAKIHMLLEYSSKNANQHQCTVVA